jgi:transcriptional regulator with XRE-family HTH domain
MPAKTKTVSNHIYQMRRNRGFAQKQLALLLGHHFTHMVSKYESGISLPPLETALLLEIALGVRLSELYVDLYQDLQIQVVTRSETLPKALRRGLLGRILGKDEDEHT